MMLLAASVSVRLSGFLVVLCFGSSWAMGQTLRINDGDVSFAEMRAEGEPAPVSRRLRRPEMQGASRRLSVNRQQGLNRLEQTIYEQSARFKIDPDLVLAVVWQESNFRPGAISVKNARGLMQLMPETAARFNVRDPHDPEESIRGGVAYLVWLLDRFGGNVALALAGYNAGERSVEAYLYGRTVILSSGKVINRRGIRNNGIPPYAETVNYVRKVAERYRLLRMARLKASEVAL